MRKIIGVKFTDLDDEEFDYIAYSKSDCRDEIDKGMFDLVNEFYDVITQGCMIAEPIYG